MNVEQLYRPNKPYHNTTEAQEAWRRKNEPEWKRKKELMRFAIEGNFLKELSAKQQEAITVIFPESGGHNSVNEAAGKLHKSVPAIRSAFNLGMEQLESKKKTGKFLEKGRPRSRPIEASNGQEKQPTKRDQKRRIRKANADWVNWARGNGLLGFNSKILTPKQKEVLNKTFPENHSALTWSQLKKGAQDELPSVKHRQEYHKVLATGINKISLISEGKLLKAGRPRKSKGESTSIIDSRLRQNRGIEFKKRMRPRFKQVDISELQSLINLGLRTAQIAKHFNLSWPTIEAIAARNNIVLPKYRRGQPGRIKSAVL